MEIDIFTMTLIGPITLIRTTLKMRAAFDFIIIIGSPKSHYESLALGEVPGRSKTRPLTT